MYPICTVEKALVNAAVEAADTYDDEAALMISTSEALSPFVCLRQTVQYDKGPSICDGHKLCWISNFSTSTGRF